MKVHPLLNAYLQHSRLARKWRKQGFNVNANVCQLTADSYKAEWFVR